MKRLFWITFFVCMFFICNINEIDSVDYSHLLEDKDISSVQRINVDINSNDLINLLKDKEVYLISVKTDINKNIVVDGMTIEEQVQSINNRVYEFLDSKGLGEKGLYYYINGINLTSIKVFGKNENIYELTSDL